MKNFRCSAHSNGQLLVIFNVTARTYANAHKMASRAIEETFKVDGYVLTITEE